MNSAVTAAVMRSLYRSGVRGVKGHHVLGRSPLPQPVTRARALVVLREREFADEVGPLKSLLVVRIVEPSVAIIVIEGLGLPNRKDVKDARRPRL